MLILCFQVQAHDRDGGRWGRLRYELQEHNNKEEKNNNNNQMEPVKSQKHFKKLGKNLENFSSANSMQMDDGSIDISNSEDFYVENSGLIRETVDDDNFMKEYDHSLHERIPSPSNMSLDITQDDLKRHHHFIIDSRNSERLDILNYNGINEEINNFSVGPKRKNLKRSSVSPLSVSQSPYWRNRTRTFHIHHKTGVISLYKVRIHQ